MILRHQVIQTLLDLYDQPNYLEIGVNKGDTFHSVQAHAKVAVDPKFLFPAALRDPSSEYYEITSEEYFGNHATGRKFDVIYLDGLHTFEQTLRDLISSVICLKPSGVIVIDDVLPNSFHAALPDHAASVAARKHLGISDPSWMGDVFKLVFFIQTYFQLFDFSTVKENHGQLIMWRSARPSVKHRSIIDFAYLSFADVIMHLSEFRIQPLDEIRMNILLTMDDARSSTST